MSEHTDVIAESGIVGRVVNIIVDAKFASLDDVSFVEKIREYARNKYAEKRVSNNFDKSEILIPWRGIKHALSSNANRNQAAVALKLDDVIREAIPYKVEEDKKKRTDIKAVHHYRASVSIDGTISVVNIVIREHRDGKRYYDHYEIKRPAGHPGGVAEANTNPAVYGASTNSGDNITPVTESVNTFPIHVKEDIPMVEIIKCNFNLFDEGRKYTGHHRNYILESAVKVCYAPATREGIRLREKLGYLGHGRREIARKLQLNEVEQVKLADGSTIIVENVPSNITTFFEVNKEGNVEHHQEILETAPGKVVAGLNTSKVGGFSWACGGDDGGSMGATRITNFHGFDYVMNPGFSANRGYILESADSTTREMILESICKTGVEDKVAELYLNSWAASAQLRAIDLEEQLEQAAIYEDAIREELEGKAAEIVTMQEALAAEAAAKEARKKLVLECAGKSVIVVPDKVVNALLSMSGEADFFEILGFFESASRVDLGTLPLPGNEKKDGPRLPSQFRPLEAEYGKALAGYDFAGDKHIFRAS